MKSALCAVAAVVALSTNWGRAAAEQVPQPSVSGTTTGDGLSVSATGPSDSTTSSPSSPGTIGQTEVDDCGPPPAVGHVVISVADVDTCTVALNECAGRALLSATGQPVSVLSTRTSTPTGDWRQGPVDCAAATAPPGPDQTAIRDAFTKLIPHPTLKTAPPDGSALVNTEVLIWLDSPGTVNLGTTPLAGHQITLTATITTITWNFGDGHATTTSGPGRPFLTTDHCATPTCPDWFGHTYATTGPATLTATITWAGHYSTDNGPTQPITGTVTTPLQAVVVHVYQSRTVLVPNPANT